MSEAADAARRRQLLMHTLALVPVGTGQCPDCHQRAEIFSRRQTTPVKAKERCLECWRGVR
jgi:hypothetical protein